MRWNWIVFSCPPRAWVDYTKFRLSYSIIRREDAKNTEKFVFVTLLVVLSVAVDNGVSDLD